MPMIEKVHWPAPARVKAYTTTRQGGVSLSPYESFNLATHVGDDPEAVQKNRELLMKALGLPAEPAWLEQVHSSLVVDATEVQEPLQADGSYTNQPGVVSIVMTADCLPVLICNRDGTRVAAVHAGWKGLASGVVESALDQFDDQPEDLFIWLGPAIGPQAFEVGSEVRKEFMDYDSSSADAFTSTENGKWMANLYGLAKLRLAKRGITNVSGGGLCTYSDTERYYSYRRDGVTGRMATLIWIDPE